MLAHSTTARPSTWQQDKATLDILRTIELIEVFVMNCLLVPPRIFR